MLVGLDTGNVEVEEGGKLKKSRASLSAGNGLKEGLVDIHSR